MTRLNSPYDDDKLTYNSITGMYELTIVFVKNAYGNPFTDDNTLLSRIKTNTRNVYNYIYNNAYSGNRKTITNIINKTEEYRNWIFDCLSTQMASDLASGYNDQAKYVPTSKEERDLQRENMISVETEQIVDSSLGYGQINLLYRGCFPAWIYLTYGDMR